MGDTRDSIFRPADGNRYTHINGLSFKGALNQLTHYGWQAFQVSGQYLVQILQCVTKCSPSSILKIYKCTMIRHDHFEATLTL